MLYQIEKKDIDKAVRVLSSSFIDYPTFRFIFPDDQYRKKKLKHLFTFFVKFGMLNGEVLATSQNIEGISIWFDSNNLKSSLISYLKAGLASVIFKIDPKSFKRFTEIGSIKQKTRSDILNTSYYYIDFVGVDPQYQKQGFSLLLIEEKLNYCDRMKIPCYVETSNQENVPFYLKFGFKIIHEYELNSLKDFCLYREPNIY